MSLWLCLRLNQLPLQCLDRSEEQAVVVVAKQRVLRANDCAVLGIREDMSTAVVHARIATGHGHFDTLLHHIDRIPRPAARTESS